MTPSNLLSPTNLFMSRSIITLVINENVEQCEAWYPLVQCSFTVLMWPGTHMYNAHQGLVFMCTMLIHSYQIDVKILDPLIPFEPKYSQFSSYLIVYSSSSVHYFSLAIPVQYSSHPYISLYCFLRFGHLNVTLSM